MSSTSIVGSLNWPMAGEGGLYKTHVITARVAGWMNFVLSLIMFGLAALALILGIVGADLFAEAAGNYEGCDQDCQDWFEKGGVLIAFALMLLFAIPAAIMMIMAKLYSVLARKMAQCCESAVAWSMTLGIVGLVLGVFSMTGTGDSLTLIVNIYFAVVFIVFPLLADVKSQLTVTKQDAHAMERGQA